jgi:hypothetical protein
MYFAKIFNKLYRQVVIWDFLGSTDSYHLIIVKEKTKIGMGKGSKSLVHTNFWITYLLCQLAGTSSGCLNRAGIHLKLRGTLDMFLHRT